ncbi:MAG TPA: CDP-alcohol phosphatidyltransferase family protein [Candidatus Nanoarchaeia archaeon]|nr:CDP-alcohol phosphatidyltransferase family protein [Candidatus Nanoarchaeia archaeon]
MKLKIKRKKIFFAVTLMRCILALIVGLSLLLNRSNTFPLFILTAFIGFFETLAARRHPNALRSVIDFFADKLLVNITAIILGIKGIIPIWAALIILARDLITIIIGTILIYKDLRTEFKPTVLGKISYFFQLMALVQPIISLQIDWYIMGTALVLTVISGIYSLIKSEFRLIRKARKIDDYRIFSLLKLADIFTLFNVALGLISIVFAMSDNFDYAAYVLLIAVVFDYLDGKIAVSMQQQNSFGKELDSLSDTVSFGVAPAIFGFSLMQYLADIRHFQITFGIISFTVFLFCGVLRLARYNIMDMKGVYQGMPITLNGVIIPLVYFAGSKFYPLVYIKFLPYIYLLLGILMVSSLKIKKL